MEKGSACCKVAVCSLHTGTNSSNANDGNETMHYDLIALAGSNTCSPFLQGTDIHVKIAKKLRKRPFRYSMTSLPLTSPDWLGDGQVAQLASKTRFLCSARVSQRYTTTTFNFECNIAISQTTGTKS